MKSTASQVLDRVIDELAREKAVAILMEIQTDYRREAWTALNPTNRVSKKTRLHRKWYLSLATKLQHKITKILKDGRV